MIAPIRANASSVRLSISFKNFVCVEGERVRCLCQFCSVFLVGSTRSTVADTDQDQPTWWFEQQRLPAELTNLPANAISRYGISELATNGDKRAGKGRRSNAYVKNPAAIDTAGPKQRANLFAKSGIGPTHRTRPSEDQTLRRLRPLRRRRLITVRPPGVLIRLRKPCLFLRFRLWGWNVRFIGYIS